MVANLRGVLEKWRKEKKRKEAGKGREEGKGQREEGKRAFSSNQESASPGVAQLGCADWPKKTQ